MGQVNVNTPGDGTAGEPAGSSGAGFILGIIIAIILIAVLVYVFVLAPGGDSNGGTDPAATTVASSRRRAASSCGTRLTSRTSDPTRRPGHRAGASLCATFLTLGSLRCYLAAGTLVG